LVQLFQMKQVYVLRHAQKDTIGNLTQEGRESSKSLGKELPQFKIVIASDSPRTQETATLLTGISPKIDSRAGYFNAPKEVSDEINKQAKLNSNGFAGAYLSNKEIEGEVIKNAVGLLDLIFETLKKLDANERALIVSHEITIVPAAKLFTKNNTIQSFSYLSGYIIDENKKLTPFSL